ncbi:MAG TPA: DUF2214 family protein [Rhizomicrobium sp.]
MSHPQADLVLAVAHHLLAFCFAGTLAFEIAVATPDLTAPGIRRLARAAACGGVLWIALPAVGFSRAVLAAKGWDFYSANPFFWAALAAFAAVLLLAIVTAVEIGRWRRDTKKFATSTPCREDVLAVRRLLWLEAAALAPVLVLAVCV